MRRILAHDTECLPHSDQLWELGRLWNSHPEQISCEQTASVRLLHCCVGYSTGHFLAWTWYQDPAVRFKDPESTLSRVPEAKLTPLTKQSLHTTLARPTKASKHCKQHWTLLAGRDRTQTRTAATPTLLLQCHERLRLRPELES